MDISGQKDTIAAIATPAGQGGIGVVRLSGADAKAVFFKVWEGKLPPNKFETHKLYYGNIQFAGETVDSVLAVWMAGPKTYTGEDVVEISGHGGLAVMQRVLNACLSAGARPAEAGEFTRRAFLNGKIDLVQAEAVADLIAASSEEGLKQARIQLEGRLSDKINAAHKELVGIRAAVEAAIDFPEEDISSIESQNLSLRMGGVFCELTSLAATFAEGRLLREGVNVAIVGRPNAGKSSLFNALAGHDRAIVHHSPGTTRDIVGEDVCLNGILFHLKDTAGLRDAHDDVEKIGVELAVGEADKADIALYVIDACEGAGPEDLKYVESLPPEKTIIVLSKADLCGGKKTELRGLEKFASKISISSLTGLGMDELKLKLSGSLKSRMKTESSGAKITNARHRSSLDKALKNLSQARDALSSGRPPEFIAQDLKLAQDFLGEITGRISTEDMLSEIFSKFCIGK